MKKKILSTLLAGAAIATMGITTAQASHVTLDDVVGVDIIFNFGGYDAAQTTYTVPEFDAGIICGGGTVAAGVTACNGAASGEAPGAVPGEDTWGVATIGSIRTSGDGHLWADGDEFLIAYFYGFEDFQVVGTGTDFDGAGPLGVFTQEVTTWSTGGHVDIYRVADLSIYDTIRLAGPSAASRLAFTTALSSETLYLGLDFIPGCSEDANDGYLDQATLCGDFDPLFSAGKSDGRAVVTSDVARRGDAWAKYPETFEFEQSVFDCEASDGSDACPNGGPEWTVKLASGSATTTAVPEPGALGLLGLGLVGMGLLGRRRKA